MQMRPLPPPPQVSVFVLSTGKASKLSTKVQMLTPATAEHLLCLPPVALELLADNFRAGSRFCMSVFVLLYQ
jgi:hypothetical protein